MARKEGHKRRMPNTKQHEMTAEWGRRGAEAANALREKLCDQIEGLFAMGKVKTARDVQNALGVTDSYARACLRRMNEAGVIDVIDELPTRQKIWGLKG